MTDTTLSISTVLRDRLVKLGRKNERLQDTLLRVCPKLNDNENKQENNKE